MAEEVLAARSPLAGVALVATAGGGVTVTDRSGLQLARLVARKSCVDRLAASLHAHFGIELPRGPRRATSASLALIGIGVDAWLAVTERGQDAARTLGSALADCAAVSAQSGGYAVLRVEGPQVRPTLAKLLPIDLHPREFPPGAAASTLAAHAAVTLWRLEDAPDGTSVFEIVVPRSLTVSFTDALAHSAAEFGFKLVALAD